MIIPHKLLRSVETILIHKAADTLKPDEPGKGVLHKVLGKKKDMIRIAVSFDPHKTGFPGFCRAHTGFTERVDIFVTSQDNNVYNASWNPAFICKIVGNRGPSSNRLNAGPGARRFVYAPRFASNAALARFVDGTARNQFFATDTDSGMIVTRYRMGTRVDDVFTPFCRLGEVPSPRRIAAFLQTNPRSQVLVTSNNGNLYRKGVKTDNTWTCWRILEKPSGSGSFLDMDAAYNAGGTNQIYVIGNDKRLYTRRRLNKQPDSPLYNHSQAQIRMGPWRSFYDGYTEGKYVSQFDQDND